MVIEIKLGDIVRLKKKHPCGSYEWQVIRLGADIQIKCLKCQRHVFLERSTFERRVSTFITRGHQVSTDKTKELESELEKAKDVKREHHDPPDYAH